MNRVLAAVCGVLTVAVAGLALQVRDARARIDALEADAAAHTAGTARVHDERDARDERDQRGDREERIDDARGDAPAPVARAATQPVPPREGWAPRATAAPAQEASASPSHQKDVGDLVRGELQRVEDEKQQAREERQRARIGKSLDQLQADAALTSEQRGKLEDMLQAELVEIRQIMTDARDSDDWADSRDKIRAVRKKTDENAGAILDDKQKPAFKQMRDDDRPRGRGR